MIGTLNRLTGKWVAISLAGLHSFFKILFAEFKPSFGRWIVLKNGKSKWGWVGLLLLSASVAQAGPGMLTDVKVWSKKNSGKCFKYVGMEGVVCCVGADKAASDAAKEMLGCPAPVEFSPEKVGRDQTVSHSCKFQAPTGQPLAFQGKPVTVVDASMIDLMAWQCPRKKR